MASWPLLASGWNCCPPASRSHAGSRCWPRQEVNAFSLPGGRIYITRGLCRRIADDEDLLAAAIAHKMSHLLRRDGLKPTCVTAKESFDREVEADAGAVALLAPAGYPPAGLARLLDLTADVQPTGWAENAKARVLEQCR